MSETPSYKRIIEERLSHEIFSNDYLVKDSATEGTTRILISEFIDLVLADSPTEEDLAKILNDLAPEFSTQYSYTSGNIVTYQEQLYEFTASKPAGNWDSSKVTQKSVSQLIADVKSTLGTRISNESTARANADTALGGRIDDEAYYRSMSDIVLSEDIAEPYNTTKNYVVGDIVSHNLYIYRCTGATTGTWDASKWEQVTVDELFDDLNFSADAISYDNETSGLEAENVQDAIGETITKLSAVGSASGEIATFTDGSDLSMPKLEVAIEPVQDLHGYDAPWVGGAGKNKLQVTAITQTINGVTFTVNSDGTVNLSGTATGTFVFPLISGTLSFSSDTIITGGYAEASASKVALRINGSNLVPSEGYTISANTNITEIAIRVNSGFNTNGVKLYPMIRLATVSDATFAPYSNICPIIGWDECNVNRAKVYQICEPSDSTEVTANGVTMTYLGKGKYRVKGTLTANEYTSLNLPIVPFTIYGGEDCYIKLNNSVGSGAVSIIFKNNTSQVDAWGLYPSNRSGSYVGMRNKYTNNITIEIISLGYGTNFDFTFKVEILSNSTANLSTYNISFGSAGTVYGGSLDVVSGELVVDRASVTVDENSNVISGSGGLPFRIDLLTGAKASSSASALTGVKCNFLKEVTQSSSWGVDGTFSRVTTDAKIVYFKVNSEITTTQQLKTFLQSNNLQFVYELATPLTIQLSPTVVKSLRGMNNVFADSGAILDAEYIRDLTAIINYILEQLNA